MKRAGKFTRCIVSLTCTSKWQMKNVSGTKGNTQAKERTMNPKPDANKNTNDQPPFIFLDQRSHVQKLT